MYDINHFKELIAPHLEANTEVSNYDIIESPPKEIGCNMTKIKVMVQGQNGKEELIHLIAKTIPVTEFSKEVYDIQVTFKKELAFYKEIVPVFEAFQKEEGLRDLFDNFAHFYGGRLNLHGNSDAVDEDAVILLEDLSVKGFGNSNFEKGFDLDLSKQILLDLAKFHGTMIALKFKKPEVFQTKIRSHCAPFNFPKDKVTSTIFNAVEKLILTFPEYAHLAAKAAIYPKLDTPKTFREPFATLIHFDLWVNNIMNKVENDGIVENIFVDFQLYDYRSPASDVFFFLWTSVQTAVLQEHLDHLLKSYHQNLLEVLSNFKIDTSGFTYENFDKELQIESEFEFGHSLLFVFYLRVITIEQESDDFVIEDDDIDPETKDRVHFMVAECHRRKWL